MLLIVAFSFSFNIYHKSTSPPAFNADEAAFGYNAYSILQTGRDEYGIFLPLRLKSFGDYKMPMYAYLSIPFIALFDLNEDSIRFLNTCISLLLPIAIFFLSKELFGKVWVGILTAFLVSSSLGLHIVGRHAHEAYLACFFIVLSGLYFLKVIKKTTIRNSSIFFIFITLALFTYQSSRIFAVYFFIASFIAYYYKCTTKSFLFVFFIVLLFFGATDVYYKPERVKNLLFFNNIGFNQKISELKIEGGKPWLYNTTLIGTRDIATKTLQYFSPNFLIDRGDENPRFGFLGMSPITVIEYLFLFIGGYYLFRKKEKFRYFLIGLLLISPLSASLAWADMSLTRSLFLLIPILIISAYGMVLFVENIKNRRLQVGTVLMLVVFQGFSLFYSWDFYFNHYPKRALVIRSWESGYKELENYLKTNYNTFNTFYITRKHGQPYIFILFYSKYSPSKYQAQAKLSVPDEYGFGQVESFDKYNFNFNIGKNPKNVSFIGYPDDFNDKNVNKDTIKKISKNTEEIFWIYEAKK